MCASIKVAEGKNCHTFPPPPRLHLRLRGPDPRACQASPSRASRCPPRALQCPGQLHILTERSSGALVCSPPRSWSCPGDSSASRLLLGCELTARCSLGRSSRAGSRRQSTREPTPRCPQHPALLASSTFPLPPSLFFRPLPPLGLLLGEGRGREKVPSV